MKFVFLCTIIFILSGCGSPNDSEWNMARKWCEYQVNTLSGQVREKAKELFGQNLDWYVSHNDLFSEWYCKPKLGSSFIVFGIISDSDLRGFWKGSD